MSRKTRFVDMSGQKYGRLTVIKRVSNILSGGQYRTAWECGCDCGNILTVIGKQLRNGKTKSCGCLAREGTSARFRKDITGQRFGRLLVTSFAHNRAKVACYWNCLCDCGNTCVKKGTILRNKECGSCGCIQKDRSKIKEKRTKNGVDRLWTKEEEQILIDNYGKNYDEIGKLVNKSRSSVGGKIIRLKKSGLIKKIGSKPRNGQCVFNGAKSKLWKGCGDISGHEFARMKNNARSRKSIFDISIEDVWNRYIKQDKRCNYTGIELNWDVGTSNSAISTCGTSSLDQIIPGKGYIIDNIQILHKDVNKMKHDLTEKEFFNYVYLIVNPISNHAPYEYIEINRGHRWTGYGNISGVYFNNVRNHALSRGIKLEISIEDIWNIFIEQRGRCNLTGIPIDFSIDGTGYSASASLDRIANNKGYTKDNVQWVHKDVNNIKWEFSEEYLKEMCKLIIHKGL